MTVDVCLQSTLNPVMRRAAAALAIASCLSLAVVPCARAEIVDEPESAIRLAVVGHAVDERAVSLEVHAPVPCREVAIAVDGSPLVRIAIPEGSASVLTTVALGSSAATFTATGFDAAGRAVMSMAEPLTINATAFLPAGPRVGIARERTVAAGQEFAVRVSGAREVTASVGGVAIEGTTALGRERVVLRLPAAHLLPHGRQWMSVTAENAWGSRTAILPVWNLRWMPTRRQAVLVDESDLELYFVSYGRVQRVYLVAIGMPGTQTPLGSFWLARPRAGGGSWGVIRMPLLKLDRWGRLRPFSSYAIHGTNQPDTIGTQASYGCVRMLNRDVLDLARRTRTGSTLVLIRR